MNSAPTEKGGGFDPHIYSDLYEAEDRHFWFRGRNKIIAAALAPITNAMGADSRILEVGCGSGNTTRVLQRLCGHAQVIGMDLLFDGLRYAQARGVACLVQGDVTVPPFSVPFDLVGMFDVLEHVPDDIAALRHLHGLLRTGARLVLTVPAHAALWSYFDELSCHCRRYEIADLTEKLLRTDYKIEYLTEFMMFSYPLVWLQRRLVGPLRARSYGPTETARNELRIHPLPNAVLGCLQKMETSLVRRRQRLPFGTSILVVACKCRANSSA